MSLDVRVLSLREEKDGGHCGLTENTPPRSLMCLSPLPWSTESRQGGGWQWAWMCSSMCSSHGNGMNKGINTACCWVVMRKLCLLTQGLAQAGASESDSEVWPQQTQSVKIHYLSCRFWHVLGWLVQPHCYRPHLSSHTPGQDALLPECPKPCSGETGCVSPLRGTSSVDDSSGSHGAKAVITTQLVQVWHVSAWPLAALDLHRNYCLEGKH